MRQLLRLAALAASLPLADAQDHFYFHPAGASFAARCPDVPAALAALDESVYGRLLGNPDVLRLIAMLDGKESVTREEIIETVDMVGFGEGVAAASISVSAENDDLAQLFARLTQSNDPAATVAESGFVRVVLDFTTERAQKDWAESVSGWAAYWGLEAVPEPPQPSASERLGLEEGEILVSRYKLAAGVDTVGGISNISAGRRTVLTIGHPEVLPRELRTGENPIFGGPDEPLLDLHLSRGLSNLLKGEMPSGFALVAEMLEPVLSPFFGWANDGGRLSVDAVDGAFRTQSVRGQNEGPFSDMVGTKGLHKDAIAMVHPSARAAYVAAFDPVAAAAGVASPLLKDIFGSMGDVLAVEIQGLEGLFTAPPVYLNFTLSDRDRLLATIPALEEELRSGFGSAAEFNRSEYRGASLFTLSLRMSRGMVTSALGVRPTLVVLEDRAFLCASVALAKRRLRQLAESEVHRGLAAVPAPQGASVISYGDWGTFVKEAYGYGLDLGPVAARALYGTFGIAVDLETLPPPSLFVDLADPSWAWSLPGSDEAGSMGARGESLTTYGPLDALSLLSAVYLFEQSRPRVVEAPVAARALPSLARAQAKLTNARLAMLDTLILSHILNEGSAPATLDALIQAAPDSFTNGAEEALDAWGNRILFRRVSDFEYRLWSRGSNQVDDDGAGDDMVFGY